MKSLIVGMGFGQLYKDILTKAGHIVTTVDPDPMKNADFATVEDAIDDHGFFDTVNICTPNFLHDSIARLVAPHAKIVFVEKPGLATAIEWETLLSDFPDTRFMMVKNNQYRDNILEIRDQANNSNLVELLWMNKDRVPNPGTWFTTKSKAFGGVSRDLMPHLLSFFTFIEPNFAEAVVVCKGSNRNWELKDLTTSDYGTVQADGVYDVDDDCSFGFGYNDRAWSLNANWKTDKESEQCVSFSSPSKQKITIELGLCPEEAYATMVATAISNMDNDVFWIDQATQDTWIHYMIDSLKDNK